MSKRKTRTSRSTLLPAGDLGGSEDQFSEVGEMNADRPERRSTRGVRQVGFSPAFNFADDSLFELPTPELPQIERQTSQLTTTRERFEADSSQLSLLSNFWEADEAELTPEQEREEQRVNEFFSDSITNTRATSQDLEDSVSRRIQVGLYPSDAALLEELFIQSKAAGLKNVSRARILRVALRHFHTCWLNADKG